MTISKTVRSSEEEEEEDHTLQGRRAGGQCPPARLWPRPPRVLRGHPEQLSDRARGWPSRIRTALHTSPAAWRLAATLPLLSRQLFLFPSVPLNFTQDFPAFESVIDNITVSPSLTEFRRSYFPPRMTTLLKVQAPQCSIQENTTSDLSAPQYPNLP
jgi:hypothetical protein